MRPNVRTSATRGSSETPTVWCPWHDRRVTTQRPATADDEPFLWELLYESLYAPPGEPRPSRELLAEPRLGAYVTGFGTRPGAAGIVALDGAAGPVGAVWARRRDAADPGYGFVDTTTPELSIATVDGWRGRGIGGQLLAALQREIGRCSLSVDVRNPALRLYTRLGFVRVADAGDDGHWTMLYDPG